MAGYETSSLSEFVRERPRAVVVGLSALVLVAGSVVALSRAGETPDDSQDVLVQSATTPTPEPDVSLDIPDPEDVPSARPSTTGTPTSTAAVSASATATPAPRAPAPRPGDTQGPVTTVPPTTSGPRPSAPAPPTTAPVVTLPPVLEPIATPSPTSGPAQVTVTNDFDGVASFRVNDGLARVIQRGRTVTIEFQVRGDGGDSYDLASVLVADCRVEQGSSGLGLEPNGAYAVTIVGEGGCPTLATKTGWPRA